MDAMNGMWRFHKITGNLEPVALKDALTVLAAELPAAQYPSRFVIARGLCDGGMLETVTHAYSTRTTKFRRFIRRVA